MNLRYTVDLRERGGLPICTTSIDRTDLIGVRDYPLHQSDRLFEVEA